MLLALVLFLTIYGNIALKGREPSVSYLNVFLQVVNSQNSSSSTYGSNVYFVSMPGKRVSGETIVQNTNKKQGKVSVEPEGELAEKGWLEIEKENFKIKPNETAKISLVIDIPADAEARNYTGRLRIEMR